MLKFGLILMAFGLIIFQPTLIATETESVEKPQTPDYAKWGRLAMEETKKRYPDADIIDYLHIGKEIGDEKSTEKFKLWLRRGSKEFGVYIHIEFDNKTEKIISWTFTETDR